MFFKELSRREREVLITLYQLKEASVKEVEVKTSGNASYSTIRTILGTLVKKGYVEYQASGLRYVYYPVLNHDKAAKNAIKDIMKTFYGASPDTTSIDLVLRLLERITETEKDDPAKSVIQNETQKKKRCSDLKQ